MFNSSDHTSSLEVLLILKKYQDRHRAFACRDKLRGRMKKLGIDASSINIRQIMREYEVTLSCQVQAIDNTEIDITLIIQKLT